MIKTYLILVVLQSAENPLITHLYNTAVRGSLNSRFTEQINNKINQESCSKLGEFFLSYFFVKNTS